MFSGSFAYIGLKKNSQKEVISMKTESDLKMTDLDYLTASPHLQMIKAALPYIHVPEQRFFSMIVKLSELNRSLQD